MENTNKPHLEWWLSISDEESINILKIEGIFGHDEGVTESEIKEFFNKRFEYEK